MKHLLILVDIQNGFTQEPNSNALVTKIEQLLKLNIFDVVIATQFINIPGGRFEKFLNWDKLQTEEERAIREEVKPYIDKIIIKDTYNCVNDAFIETLKQYNDGTTPASVCIAGVDTDCCVQTIAVSLFEHDIRPIVLAYYCDSNGGSKSHEAGLTTLERTIGQESIIEIAIESKPQLNKILSNLC